LSIINYQLLKIMIASLHGKLIVKSSTEIVVECGGVGYLAMASVNSTSLMPDVGNEVNVFTFQIFREDAVQLFAFFDMAEREVFKMLVSIPGVGGKTAIAILSSIKVDELQQYILSGNIPALQKLPGIGRKTAERLIVELRDKITKVEIKGAIETDKDSFLLKEEAMSALMTLGYSRPLADKSVKLALAEAMGKELTAEALIRKALKHAMS
jgi:holliday junction DNA helicase RuvA